MCFCCVEEISKESELLEKVLPAIISGAIIIALFIIGKYSEKLIRKGEVRRTWYLNVLVNPNIERIENFFNSMSEISNESINILFKERKGSCEDYRNIKVKQLLLIKYELKHFELGYLGLFKSYSEELFDELYDWSRNYNDKIMGILDEVFNIDDTCSEDIEEKMRNEIANNKVVFYSILNSQITPRKPKKGYYGRIKNFLKSKNRTA